MMNVVLGNIEPTISIVRKSCSLQPSEWSFFCWVFSLTGSALLIVKTQERRVHLQFRLLHSKSSFNLIKCDRKFSSPSLLASPEWWVSPSTTNCLVGVKFSPDMIIVPITNSMIVEKSSRCLRLNLDCCWNGMGRKKFDNEQWEYAFMKTKYVETI